MKNAIGFAGYSAFKAYNKVCFYLPMIRYFNFQIIDQTSLILALKSCETIEEYQEVAEQLTGGVLKPIIKNPADVIKEFKKMPDEQKRAALLEAITFCELTEGEVFSLIYMQDDPNGIPWDKASVSNLSPEKMADIMVNVMIEFSKLNFDFGILSEKDHEMLKTGRVSIDDEVADIIANNEKTHIKTVLPVAVKRILKRIFEYNSLKERD